MQLNIKKFNIDSKLPSYGSDYAAGLDLYSSIDYDVQPNSRKLIPTGISVSWNKIQSNLLYRVFNWITSFIWRSAPDEYYLRVAPRSGLSVKHNIDIGAGVVDSDYRGEIFVCFINNDKTNTYSIKKDDKIAQMIPTKICRFNNIIEVNEHTETKRGSGGFGSTGK